MQIVALDWKWLFIYPDQHVATVNELVIPAGLPVHFSLTSGTVMQSLLMPRLASQIYAMAGMTTQLNFAADQPGDYWGENTQFSGMGFKTKSLPYRHERPKHSNGGSSVQRHSRTGWMSPPTRRSPFDPLCRIRSVVAPWSLGFSMTSSGRRSRAVTSSTFSTCVPG